MNWVEVSVTTDGEAAEAIAEYLSPFAYNRGVVFEQLGDSKSSSPNALESTVNVKIYLPEEPNTEEIRRKIEEVLYQLNRIYPVPKPSYRILVEEDWANAWKDRFTPFRIGKNIWIQPSWISESEHQHGDIVITIDPGMAFGTGLHPSTQLCLEGLEQFISPGSHVLDVGTGSGILAIASGKLGADQVAAFDTDAVAAHTALSNVKLNNLSQKISVFQGDLTALSPRSWDLILVNILAPVIVSLIKDFGLFNYLSEGGKMILSGIIKEQAAQVISLLQEHGGVLQEEKTIGDWVALITTKTPEQ